MKRAREEPDVGEGQGEGQWRDEGPGVSLADRLNPKRRGFDADFKARWDLMSKAQRKKLAKADRKQVAKWKQSTAHIVHPFDTESDDHCETDRRAYEDLVPVLNLVAEKLGKDPAELRIYDPYYCAGTVVKHFAKLGFPQVYNRCQDFYAVVAAGKVPDHDVLVTNPPYSGDHVERLLQFLAGPNRGKPFCLLMPNYFACRRNYHSALDGLTPVFLRPTQSQYFYWTPSGMRDTTTKKKAHHNLALGHRTSPFPSSWHLDLSALGVDRSDLLGPHLATSLCSAGGDDRELELRGELEL